MKKKMLSLILCLCMMMFLFQVSVLATDGNPFTDVKTSDWYYDEVQYVYENGLIKGITANLFDPAGLTTRGQIVTILYRLDGRPEVTKDNPFKDVAAGLYYEEPITWAAENTIVSGYSADTFGPGDSITREQMASILYRYARYKGYDITKRADLSIFEDLSKLSSYAQNSMAWANGAGLISGFTATKLEPQGNAMRAQVAAILYRFCEKIVPKEVEEEHIHVWDDGVVTKEATESEAGEYTYKCTGCGESVTAVLVKTDEQLNEAMEDGKVNIAVMNANFEEDLHAHIAIPEDINFRMAGTTIVEAGAALILTEGNVYIDHLILKTDDQEGVAGAYLANRANLTVEKVQVESGKYYGILADEDGNIYPNITSAHIENMGIFTVTDELVFENYAGIYNEGHMLISKTGRLTLSEGERVEYGYYTLDENGEITLTPEEWNEERGEEGWYDVGSGAGIDNFGQIDVNGKLEIGKGSYLNNGIWSGGNEKVALNVYGKMSISGNLNNVPDGSLLNVVNTVTIEKDGYLGNDSVVNVNEKGKIVLGSNAGFDNSSIGTVILDGKMELSEAEYIGITEYSDEWGNAWGEYANASWMNNDGTFTVNGEVTVDAGSSLNNRENAEFVINGAVSLELGDHQEAGYFTVADDGKVEFAPGEVKEEWGGEYFDEETGKFYRYYDEWTVASLNNDGTLVVNGTLAAAGLNNNAYSYEGENGLQVVEAQITVTKGGTLTVIGWMNNNSSWYEEAGETKWAVGSLLIEKDGNFILETQSSDKNESFNVYFGNSGSVVIDGIMTISRLSTMHNWCNERWEDFDGNGESEFISSYTSELIINGELDMTDTNVLYEEYYDEDLQLTITVPVDTQAPHLLNDGYLEVSGIITEKASNFESNGTVVVGENGTLKFDSIWCDVDGDESEDTYAGNDVCINGDTIVFGKMLNLRRVVCNWGEGELAIRGKLTMQETGDLYIGENAGFTVSEDAQVDLSGGRVLIYDREDAEYDEYGNVLEWKGTISRHLEEDYSYLGTVLYTANIGSSEGLMAAIEEGSGFNSFDLIEEITITEDTFISGQLNIIEGRLVVEDGNTVTINGILYNYTGMNLELQGDARVELAGDTTGKTADHFYWGYADGLDISEDVKQPAGSDFAYKTIIRNAE